jgi:hypothetical protein
MGRTVCMGCDKYDDCGLWLVLSETYCPDRTIETNPLGESSHQNRNLYDASIENGGSDFEE